LLLPDVGHHITFAAAIVKLHALDEEQLVLAGESVADHLDGAGDDLDVLESAIALDLVGLRRASPLRVCLGPVDRRHGRR